MKKVLSLVFVVLTLFSCSKEDDKSSEAVIKEFSINSVKGTIDESGKKISLSLPYGTDVKTLAPSVKISDKAKVSPASGVSHNFAQPVIYTVTAEDGSTAAYTVTVNVAKNDEAKISAFLFEALTPVVAGDINETDKTISLMLLPGTDLKTLVPSITYSEGATVSPKTGIVQDFTQPVIYTVTSEKGDQVKYTVKAGIDQSSKRITSFEFSSLSPAVTATIDEAGKSISAIVPYGTDIRTLSPVVVVSTGATVSPGTGMAADFTDPVDYTVTAIDKSTAVYKVTVTVAPFEAKITGVNKTSVGINEQLTITGTFGSYNMITLKRTGAIRILEAQQQSASTLIVTISDVEEGTYTLYVTSNGTEISYPTPITVTAPVTPQPTLISLDKTEYITNLDEITITGENLIVDGSAEAYFMPKNGLGSIGYRISINEAGNEATRKIPDLKPGDYTVYITFENGKKTNSLDMKIIANPLPVPTITGVSSTTICKDDEFTITGTNFSNPTVVIGWHAATVISWTSTKIVASHQYASPVAEELEVKSNGKTATYGSKITITSCPPEVTLVTANSGKRGDKITVKGIRFDEYGMSGFNITVGGVMAFGKYVSPTEFTLTVPSGAMSGAGELVIYYSGKKLYNGKFAVTE